MSAWLPGFVTRNFRLKLAATLLAVITWAGVVYAANPPGVRTVFVPVPQDVTAVPPGYVLVHRIPDLAVRLAGTQEHLNAFDRTNLVVKVHYDLIHGPGALNLPVDVLNSDANVEVVGVPTTIPVDIDRLDTITVPVRVVINPGPPAGYVTSTVQATPAQVTVTGPHHEFAGLQPRVEVNLSNQKANFESDLTVFLYDAGGNRLQDVNPTPPTVRVLITIAAVSTQRVSAVVPPILGSVGTGYMITGISVAPLTVTLTGPQDILNSLDTVATEPVNVTGITSSRTYTVLVQTKQGISPSPTSITVRVTVTALPTPTPAPTSPGPPISP